MNNDLLEQVLTGDAPALERLSVSQFHRMIDHGVLREGEPVELIDGLLVRKNRGDTNGDPMIHGPRHAYCLKRLQRLQQAVESLQCHLQCQLPVTLTEHLEPEPDGAVIRGSVEDFVQRHPGPQDIAVVVEISDSSLEYDRTTKQRIYATASIAVYWIVNIPEHRVEVYELPDAATGQYGRRTDFGPSDRLSLSITPSDRISIEVAELLPV